jgi:hypothetical protein
MQMDASMHVADFFCCAVVVAVVWFYMRLSGGGCFAALLGRGTTVAKEARVSQCILQHCFI